MDHESATAICAKVNELIESLETYANPEYFVENIDNYEEILVGAMIARGYLEGAVEISEKTLPYIEAASIALSQILSDLEMESESEDQEVDE